MAAATAAVGVYAAVHTVLAQNTVMFAQFSTAIMPKPMPSETMKNVNAFSVPKELFAESVGYFMNWTIKLSTGIRCVCLPLQCAILQLITAERADSEKKTFILLIAKRIRKYGIEHEHASIDSAQTCSHR